MHIVALICGILGLLSLPLIAFAHSPAPLFLAMALGSVAIVTGVLSRVEAAGKAGLALGLVGVLGTLAVVFLFMARSSSATSPVQVAAPTAVSGR